MKLITIIIFKKICTQLPGRSTFPNSEKNAKILYTVNTEMLCVIFILFMLQFYIHISYNDLHFFSGLCFYIIMFAHTFLALHLKGKQKNC